MRARSAILASAIALLSLGRAAAQDQPSPAPAATPATVIKDPAEAAAYAAAQTTVDPAQRAAAIEDFIRQYPRTVARIDALQEVMAAYQQLGDVAKAEQTARLILQTDPVDVRALAIVVFLERQRASALTDAAGRAALAKQAAADAGKGLIALGPWPGPAGMAPADVAHMHGKLEAIFFGALGFERLVQADYAVARAYYLKAVRADSSDEQTDYQLAMVDLRATPPDPEGFWWAAKAYVLAGNAFNSAAQTSIAALAGTSYRTFHGGDDGWDSIVAQAATQDEPPDGFTVAKAPTPAELAVQAAQENDVATLTFADWEFILSQRDASPANRAAAEKVWRAITVGDDGAARRLKVPVKVISASRGTLNVAVTDVNQEANTIDLRVLLDSPLAQAPAPGAIVSVIGVIGDYSPKPFLFTMERAQLAPG